MLGSEPPPIFIGVPIYRGWDYLDASLRSIQEQEFRNYHVLLSLDGGDERCAKICANYTNDSRFELVIQPRRLDWARHINWLMSRCDAEYFCFWQQDDLCSRSFLGDLYHHLRLHPEAACAYADLQCFGTRTERYELESVTGAPLDRVLDRLEGPRSFVAYLGLMRASGMTAAGPLRLNDNDSALEDEVWITKLAREGELHRVPGPLYFKRHHSANVHVKWGTWPRERWFAIWIEWGLGMLEAALPLAGTEQRHRLLETVIERLTVPRAGRHLYYDPSRAGATELICFAAEFLKRTSQHFNLGTGDGIRRHLQVRSIAELQALCQERLADSVRYTAESHFTQAAFGVGAAQRLLLEVALRELRYTQLCADAARHGDFEAAFAHDAAGTALLGMGWSTPESWGVWSDGMTACIRLPIPGAESWRIELQGNIFLDGLLPNAARSVRIRIGKHELARCDSTLLMSGVSVEFNVPPAATDDDRQLYLDFPDAVAPLESGLGADPRRICLALKRLCGIAAGRARPGGHAGL